MSEKKIGNNELVDKLFKKNINFLSKYSDEFDSDATKILFLNDIFDKILFLFLIFFYKYLDKDLNDLDKLQLSKPREEYISFKEQIFQILQLEIMRNKTNQEMFPDSKAVVNVVQYGLINIFEQNIKELIVFDDYDKALKKFISINLTFLLNATQYLKKRQK